MVNMNIATVEDGIGIYIAGEHILTLQLDSRMKCSGIKLYEDLPVKDSNELIVERDPVMKLLQEREEELKEMQRHPERADYYNERVGGVNTSEIRLIEIATLRKQWAKQMKRYVEALEEYMEDRA